MEDTGAFFEPTLAALFVREAFGPGIRSAVCEGSPLLHPSTLSTLRPLPWSHGLCTSQWYVRGTGGSQRSPHPLGEHSSVWNTSSHNMH